MRSWTSNPLSKGKSMKRQRSGIDTMKYHTRPSTEWERDLNTRKHHIHESQEVSPIPTSDHKAGRNRHRSVSKINIKKKQRNTALERAVRTLLEGLKF